MTNKELLLDLYQTLADALRRAIQDLPLDILRWQPDEEANNIAVTVWHISRAFDLFKVRFFENRVPEGFNQKSIIENLKPTDHAD